MALFQKKDSPVCGGSTTTIDSNAPKAIVSREIVRLSCESSFHTVAAPRGKYPYVAVFAAKVNDGVLAGLVTENEFFKQEPQKIGVVSNAVLEKLLAVVDEYAFVKSNGRVHSTAGLPENFGGHISVEYESGEEIYTADNQSPVMSALAGEALADCILEALGSERVPGLPTAADVTGIHWEERREDGGYHIIDWNGTALHTEQKYAFDGASDSVYTHDVTTAPEDFGPIRAMIDRSGLLYWGGLPESDFKLYKMNRRTLTFRLSDGSERTVADAMRGPEFTRNGIFETEMAVNDILRKYE